MFASLYANGASKKKPVEVKRSTAKPTTNGTGNGTRPSQPAARPGANATRSQPLSSKRKLEKPTGSKSPASRRPQQRRSQSVQTPMFGSEDSESESEANKTAKRRRLEAEEVDKDRQIRRADMFEDAIPCLLYTSPSPRDGLLSRMPSSA